VQQLEYHRYMNRFSNVDWRQIGSYLLFAIAFIAVSFGIREYQSEIGILLNESDLWSIPLFIVLTVVFVVFVIPLDIVFLIPLGVSLWGPVPTGFLMISGWTIGAGLAFLLARRYGLPIVERLVGTKRIFKVGERIPPGELFWSIVFLRMVVPVDILSYALGLFSRISLQKYLLATALGITPFGFFFSFAGTLPVMYQVGAIIFALLLASVLLSRYGSQRQLVSDDGLNRSDRH
jgi:uncharacterized membrane protein YdjX (TVP38/TMEM64 family)